jgi:hypothetical protein
MMRALALLCLVAGAARAEDLVLLEDGKGHAIAVAIQDPKSRIYYGDGKSFVAVPVDPAENTGPMPNGDITRHFLDPRFPSRKQIKSWQDIEKSQTRVSRSGGKWVVQCGTRKTPLVEGKLAPAAKLGASTMRRPHALARDDRGRYYYVDAGPEEGDKGYRIYVGEKGQMKRLKMQNVVADSEGEIYTTPQGKLRLVLGKPESMWIEEGAKRKLVVVPLEESQSMIFLELGVYAGEKLGTPCDDF